MTHPKHERLAILFDEQLRAAQSLLSALEQEAEALADQQSDSLQQLAETKDGIIGHLDRLGTEVSQILTESGLAGDRDGLDRFLSGDGSALRPQWDQLRDTLTRCRELNELNGRLLRKGHSDLQQTLGLLQAGAGNDATYAASGQAKQGPARRGPLGKA